MPAWGWAREGGAGHTAAPTGTHTLEQAEAKWGHAPAHGHPWVSSLGGGLPLTLRLRWAAGGWHQKAGGGEHSPEHPAAPAPAAAPRLPAQPRGWQRSPPFTREWDGEETCTGREAFLGTIIAPGHRSHTCIMLTPSEGAWCALLAWWHGQGGSKGHQPLGTMALSLCPWVGSGSLSCHQGHRVLSVWATWEREAGCGDASWG